MIQFENRNESQTVFNQVNGILTEINLPKSELSAFGSITVDVGRSSQRKVNIIAKVSMLENLSEYIEKPVQATFYASSKKKNERWHTVANLLQIENRSDGQNTFNQIKGVIVEINYPQSQDTNYGSITIEVGRSAKRKVNLMCKASILENLKATTGSLVQVSFYASSREKKHKWHTILNVLQIDKL